MSSAEKINVSELKNHKPFPGGQVRFLHSVHMTQAYWTFEKDTMLADHSHPHEQIVNVLEGTLEFKLGGTVMILEPGSAVICPSGVPHSGKALTFVRVLDVFCPVRQDFVKLDSPEN